MYALIGPADTIVKYSTEYASFDPSVPVKPGYRWVPIVDETVGDAGALSSASTAEVVEADRVVRRVTYGSVSIEQQKAAVKGEGRRRILARYPDWKQTNMVARGVELQEIWRQSGSWTAEEQAEANALAAAWGWIKSVRAASDLIELMSPIPTDFDANDRWPA